MSTAVVFGANGISGIAALKELLSRPETEWRKVIAVSRRPPVLDHEDKRLIFKSVDLLGDEKGLEKALKEAGAEDATHGFYYAYVEKSDEDESVNVNQKMFENAVTALEKISPKLKVFQLQTGYKYYGSHLGNDKRALPPWSEDSPRHVGKNFQHTQEDILVKRAKKNGWNWIITRPNIVVGTSKGNFMSMAVTVALYAEACKALGQPFYFPGSTISYGLQNDHSTASNNAAFQVFLAQNEKAWNQIYNISDDNKSTFQILWPKIAKYFDVPLPKPEADEPKGQINVGNDFYVAHSLVDWANTNQAKFPELAKQLGIDPKVFDYATWPFMQFALSRTWADTASMERARAVGWDRTLDTFEDGYKVVFEQLKLEGVIPK